LFIIFTFLSPHFVERMRFFCLHEIFDVTASIKDYWKYFCIITIFYFKEAYYNSYFILENNFIDSFFYFKKVSYFYLSCIKKLSTLSNVKIRYEINEFRRPILINYFFDPANGNFLLSLIINFDGSYCSVV